MAMTTKEFEEWMHDFCGLDMFTYKPKPQCKWYDVPDIKSVQVNIEKKVVTVIFADDTVVVQKCNEEDDFDVYVGVALAIAKRTFGKSQLVKKITKNINIVKK